jgi:predicted transcriptional regulator
MRTELVWLTNQSVISGLNNSGIENISRSVQAGSEIFIDDDLDAFESNILNKEVEGWYDVYSFSEGLDKWLPGEQVTPSDEWNLYAILGLVIATVVLILMVTFSYTRLKRRAILDNLNRKNIFEHIKANQGVHFKALLRELNFKPGAMSYHLNVLEKGEYIKSIQDGNYRRFYLFGTKSDLKIALTTIQLRILSIVNERPGISQSGISKTIGKNRMLVNYHIKILADAGIISLERSGRESQCYTTGNAETYLTGG